MAHLYFAEHLNPDDFTGTITVSGDEARHAVRVSRLRSGETILVGNGAGVIARGTVTETSAETFTVAVEEVTSTPEPAVRVWLVQALAKGDRAERAIEQSTEFGVHGVIPWQAERSIVKWDANKTPKAVSKWHKIAREAAKQSLRCHIPPVTDPVTIQSIEALSARENTRVIVLHPRNAERFSSVAKNLIQYGSAATAPRDIYLCVGPEGGLSDHELDVLERAGATIAVIGTEVLRTSSAGPAALAVLNLYLKRW